MKLDERTAALIGVGASVAANCQPCLQKSASLALQCGADRQEIADAISVGRKVRHGAASGMDHFILSLQAIPAGAADIECECGS